MVARIVLKKAKTYTLGGRRWIKDVPQTVKGEENIGEFKQNGYFHVTILSKGNKPERKLPKKKKKKAKVSSSGSKTKVKKSKSGKAKLKK